MEWKKLWTTPKNYVASHGKGVGKIIGYGLGGTALVLGGIWLFRGCGSDVKDNRGLVYKVEDKNLVYNGVEVDGKDMDYKENVDHEVDFGVQGKKIVRANILTVRDGGNTYTLIDYNGRSIDWESERPYERNNDLEEIILQRGDGIIRKFESRKKNVETLPGKKATSLFEKGSKYYNVKMRKIRDFKRGEYEREIQVAEDFFEKEALDIK